MNKKTLLSILILCCTTAFAVAQTNRYWVGASIYRNSLTSVADITEWTLSDDNGTGSWTSSATISSILKVDDLAGGFANKIENTSGGSPRLLPLDDINGAVELQVVALTAGTQFSIQLEEYSATNTLIISQEILGLQSNAGFFTVKLSDFLFDISTTQIRFIISAQNAATQGTLELNYFNYYNTNNNWSNSANWATTSGGTAGAGAPGTLDAAIFDVFSATNTIIDQPATVANITLASTYKSGLINASSSSFTVTEAAQLTGGFIVGVNDHLIVNDITLSGTQFVSTFGIITINGTFTYLTGIFKPTNGTMIFASSSSQTIPARNYTNLTFNGTGTKNVAGNFSVSGNFVNNSTFNAAGNTVVFNGVGAQSISGTSTITTFTKLTITNTSSSGISLSSPIALTGVLTLSSGARLTTTGASLTLIATSPTVTASIANLTGATIVGNVKVQKYIYSSLRVYRYLTSAVSNATVADWQLSIPITGTFSNPSTGTGIVSTVPSMYLYNENTAGVRANGYSAYPASGLSSAAALTIGKGYSIYVRNNTERPMVLEVNGPINKGTINISPQVTYTVTAGGPAEDGWNLVGNPYPSSLDWDLISTATDKVRVDNAIYYLDNNSASPVYRTWVNGVGTNAANGIISSSQAFWVKANAASPVLRFRETYKTTTAPSFYRTGTDISLLRISLDSTSSTFRDETVIRLSDEATADFDSDYDAYKLYDTGHPAIGSATNTSPLLSVNAFRANRNSSDTIALYVQTGKAGNYFLSIPEYTFDASVTAYLWDTYTDVKLQLLKGTFYPFAVSVDSVAKTSRFKVLLNEQSLTTGVFSSSSNHGLTLYPNPADISRAVTIRCPQANNRLADIYVYDVTGMLVYTEKQVQGTHTEYPMTLPSYLSNGLYSIRIQTDGITASSTLIIK